MCFCRLRLPVNRNHAHNTRNTPRTEKEAKPTSKHNAFMIRQEGRKRKKRRRRGVEMYDDKTKYLHTYQCEGGGRERKTKRMSST